MGFKRPLVRFQSLGPSNDNPNYIIQVGNVFGFIISIENSFLLKMFYSKQGQEVIPALVFPFSHDIIQSNR